MAATSGSAFAMTYNLWVSCSHWGMFPQAGGSRYEV
jgi:hypothetical protein